MNPIAWGRLLRLSLLPTAVADIAAGAVWAQGGFEFARPQPWLLVAASLCVYHGGMALNDWADRAADARARPARPIPSGAIAPRAALAVGLALLVLAPLLAFGVDRLCGVAILAVSAAAGAYDLLGRGAWLGPALLALCRAGNLGAGILLGVRHGTPHAGIWVPLQPLLLAPPLLYGAYVFCVSRVGRLEDTGEALGPRPRVWIALALACLAAAPFLPGPREDPSHGVQIDASWQRPWPLDAWQARTLAAALVGCAVWQPLRVVLATRDWTGALAMAATGALLRRLLVFTAALSIARGSLDGLWTGCAILAGYPLALALRRVFPPS